MSLPLNRYVNIISSVGGAANVATRDLGARFITQNPLVPTGSYVQFNSASDVGVFFGTSSVEYLRAVLYFSWISKVGTAPRQISFANWANVASAPLIYGAPGPQALATYTAISSGAFGLTIGGSAQTITGLNLSGATSLSNVAALIQAAIRLKTAGGAQFTAATVTYDPVRGCFNFTGGATGAAAISVQAGTGGADMAAQLGWLSTSTLLSAGSVAQSVTDVLIQTSGLSNNFGSFAFIPTLVQADIVSAAQWNDSQNDTFLYSVPVTSTTAAAISAATLAYSGVTLTLSPISTEYPEMAPMMIESATDYTARNSTQNYMYQQNFPFTPSVLTTSDANLYDGLRVNYYGQTQTAGQQIAFYQRGVMMGGTTVPTDQNTYVNEIWLKNVLGAQLLSLLLALSKVSANNTGKSQILSILQTSIDQALFNGTISPGKQLTQIQILYITQQTGDPTAWRKVQNLGYWVTATIVPYTDPISGLTQYKAVYTLIYSKDDTIRLIEGRDILI